MTDSDLKRAFIALNGKLLPYNTLFSYASGDQPLIYSTARLRAAFANINCRFSQNWCSVVVDAALDRLTLKGFDAQNSAINKTMDDLWSSLHIGLDSYETHRDALITSEGYIIVWKDEDKIDVYHNDPRMCHVFYDPERPKEKQFAAKWWLRDVWHLTLYYPERIEYYQTRSKTKPSSASAFQESDLPSMPNPYGIIPVFHFRGAGELGNIITLQDAVNKLFADMMVAAEYGAFKQRWIIANGDTSTLKNAPNEIWELPTGDGVGQQTSVGQFDATPLDNYLNAIDKISNSIAIISRTPKHYFYNSGGNLSGEALLAMEAPLTKKVDQYQERFGVTWQELGAFLYHLSSGGEINENEITPVWQPSESIQPYTEAQTRQLAITSGIPLITQLKREGWGADEIKAMQKDEEEQKKRNAKLAPILLDEARNKDASDNTNPLEENDATRSES